MFLMKICYFHLRLYPDLCHSPLSFFADFSIEYVLRIKISIERCAVLFTVNNVKNKLLFITKFNRQCQRSRNRILPPAPDVRVCRRGHRTRHLRGHHICMRFAFDRTVNIIATIVCFEGVKWKITRVVLVYD